MKALLLAAGYVTRLYPLTKTRSKPAVPIAGNYRLIDIPVSNCLNSNLRRIYVLTQYNSESLNRHLSSTYKFDVFSNGFVSVLARLDELAARGVELRVLHAELPSRPFRAELARHPRLVAGGLALRRCPRVHLKAVVVDGELLYLGSANWTGAGLGARGAGRRNFELGVVTDDGPLLDQVQSMYDRIWTGGECAACKLRDECPGPLSELAAGRRA